MTILLESERQKILEAIESAEEALKRGDVKKAQAFVKAAHQLSLDRLHAQLTPEQQQARLLEKRNDRIMRELWDQLTPAERADFDRRHGGTAVMRRLAEEALRLADEAFEAREADWQAEQYNADSKRRQMYQVGNQPVATDHNLIFSLEEQTAQKRAQRRAEREKRMLQAELHDEEAARLMATFDREELEIFQGLVKNQPTQLEALQSFVASKGHNQLEGITDTNELYNLHLQEKPPAQRLTDAPDVSNINDSTDLYNIALKQALGE